MALYLMEECEQILAEALPKGHDRMTKEDLDVALDMDMSYH